MAQIRSSHACTVTYGRSTAHSAYLVLPKCKYSMLLQGHYLVIMPSLESFSLAGSAALVTCHVAIDLLNLCMC